MVTSGLDALGTARAVAPEVDRLFRAGHRSAARHAGGIRTDFGVTDLWPLIDLRKLLLTPGGTTLDRAASIERYEERSHLLEGLRARVRDGILQEAGQQFYPSERGRALLSRITEMLERGTEDLWGAREKQISGTAELLARMVEHAASSLPSGSYPAFTAERRGFVPPSAAPPFRLWSLLATLRYLRADAHELAWREAALSARQIHVVTALWLEAPRPDDQLGEGWDPDTVHGVLRELRQRGWIRESAQGWILTEAGRERREHIEFRTNALAAPAFIALESGERERLLEQLRGLPDQPS